MRREENQRLMRYLVVPSKEWKRERDRAEEEGVRQTSSKRSNSQAKSNGFNGLWYETNKKNCSKNKNIHTQRKENNIAECRQMETPQRLWTVFRKSHTIFRTKFQSKQPTMLTISAGFIQTFPNRNQSKPWSVPSEKNYTFIFSCTTGRKQPN